MNYANDCQAYHLALAGVRFAQALLQQAPKDSNGLEDTWYKFGLVRPVFSPATARTGDLGLGEGCRRRGVTPRRASLSTLADPHVEEIGQEARDVSACGLRTRIANCP